MTDETGEPDVDRTNADRTGVTRVAAIIGSVLAVALLIAYALIAHHLTIDADRSWLGYGFAIGSIVLLILALAWSSRWRWMVIGLTILMLAGLWGARRFVNIDPRWLYLLQHAGTQALLGIVFGRTLRAGHRPLITSFAMRVHAVMPLELVAYTRSVTWAWTIYFAAMTALSLILWFVAPAAWWSVLANFLTMPLVAAMFIVEYLIRLRRFPDFKHASILEGIRAFSRHR